VVALGGCSALTLDRLSRFVFDSSLSNPWIPLLSVALCAGGVGRSWWRARRDHAQLAERLSPRLSALPVVGLICYLCALWWTAHMYPLRALNQSHPEVVGGRLSSVSLECLGLWLLWFGWAQRRSAHWRAQLTFPLIIGAFSLPWEGWLRSWDEPLQRLGATLGAWLVSRLSELSVLWGGASIELSFWNPYTFYSSEFYLIINETCSGVNLLLSSALYAVGFTWLTKGSPRAALWIVLWTIPLSLLLNGCRIAMIFLLGHLGGVELAMGPWHEGSAYLMQLPLVVALAYLSPKSQGSNGAQRSAQGA